MKTKRNTKQAKQMVAEVMYRDAGNNKAFMLMLIPDGLKIKVGDDVDVSKFGIDSEEWFERTLPARMAGFKYDEELDHTLVEVLEIRERKDDDICVNVDETGLA